MRILDGTTTLLANLSLQGNSCATWFINPPLNAGTHSLLAEYSRDSNNLPGTSAPATVTVSPTQTYLSASCGTLTSPLHRAVFMKSTGRAMAGLLSAFEEFEHEILRERIRAGLVEARRNRTKQGRPPTAAK